MQNPFDSIMYIKFFIEEWGTKKEYSENELSLYQKMDFWLLSKNLLVCFLCQIYFSEKKKVWGKEN